MSTKTAQRPEKREFHVPVDLFQIVYGSSKTECMKAVKALQRSTAEAPCTYTLLFTLMTPASKLSFKRTLKMATIYDLSEEGFQFTAYYGKYIVSGYYNMRQRVGQFSVD